MTAGQLLRLNFEEVRRRSIKVWRAIPPERLAFKVDPECMSLAEQVRHVLENDFNYAVMLRTGGDLPADPTPWDKRALGTLLRDLRIAGCVRPDVWD
jgi:hypothetical protein